MDSVIRTTMLTTPRLARSRPEWIGFAANGVGLVALLVLIFTVQSDGPTVRLNQVAGETIVAQRQVTYMDRAATAARRRHITTGIAPLYTFNPTTAAARTHEVVNFLAQAGPIMNGAAAAAVKDAEIARLVPGDVPASALQEFPILRPGEFKIVQADSRSLMEQAEAWRFSASDLQATELGLLSTIAPHLTRAERVAIGDILVSFLAPTLIPDQAATQKARRIAGRLVHPVWVTIFRGEVVVRRGDIITASIMEKLRALGVHGPRTGWNDILAALLFAALIVGALFWYLHAFHTSLLMEPRLLLLVDACILVTVLAARLLTAGHVLLPFFLPVAAASTFAAVLIAPEACIAITLAVALLAGWIVANSFELTTYYFLTGTAGVLAIRQVRQLKQFILTGAVISAFALVTTLAFGLVDHTYDFAGFQEHVLAAGFNGFLSSTLALGGFALLSSFFGVTTTLQLLELGQPNQPLLRRLMVKAPGTHNHSLIVASMVEHAAQEIGADALVAKLGALYHDVGKTANPHCFVENQLSIGNIHDELRPDESARIIRGHVSQGLRLARQFKLPRLILDAIAEHHGTTQLTYFLHKAQQEANGIPIDRSLYTYPGPKPQSKETALIMLADGCESSVRASSDHSDAKIREIVNHIFQERVQQGQLDECPMTMRDLEAARGAFSSILGSLYHPRIEYPEIVQRPAPVAPVLERERGA